MGMARIPILLLRVIAPHRQVVVKQVVVLLVGTAIQGEVETKAEEAAIVEAMVAVVTLELANAGLVLRVRTTPPKRRRL